MEYISGPVSWVGFEHGDKAFHFFGDKHGSKESNCESKGLSCASVIHRIKDANCYSIDYLLEKIFIHCERNKKYADLFLETYYQPKKSSIPRTKLEGEGYIKDVYRYFLDQTIRLDEEKMQKFDYVKQHYIDIRFSMEKCISVYDIFETLLSQLLQIVSVENRKDILSIAKDLYIELSHRRLDFYKAKDYSKFLSKMFGLVRAWMNEYEEDEMIVFFLENTEERLLDLRDFYKEKEGKKYGFYYYEFESLKNKNIKLDGKEIYPILEKYMDDKIGSIISGFPSKDEIQDSLEGTKKFLEELIKTFLLIGVTMVDGFTLAKMMKSMQKGPQIMIVFAGQFHTFNYLEFFGEVLGMKRIGGPITGNGSRCLHDSDFGKIFGRWIE